MHYTDFERGIEGGFLLSPAADVYEKFGLRPETVRQWRARGFLDVGRKDGRSYFFTPYDIAYLAIYSELAENGLALVHCAEAADAGASTLLAHMIDQSHSILLSATEEDFKEVSETLWREADLITKFCDDKVAGGGADRFLLTSGDDHGDWVLSDDLVINPKADWTLVRIVMDLQGVGARLAETLAPFLSIEQSKLVGAPRESFKVWLIGTTPDWEPQLVNPS